MSLSREARAFQCAPGAVPAGRVAREPLIAWQGLQPGGLPHEITVRLAAAVCSSVTTKSTEQHRIAAHATQLFLSTVVIDFVDYAEHRAFGSAEGLHPRHERKSLE